MIFKRFPAVTAGIAVGLGLGTLATFQLSHLHAAHSTQEFSVTRLWENVVMPHAAGNPVRVRIPAIGVDASVERVGLTASGAMDVPSLWEDVAWYGPGVRPGETGNAVMAGHLDSDNGKAVFWDLHLLKPGDVVEVDDDRGATLRFIVKETRRLLEEQAPVAEIFGPAPVARLNLITCGGVWNEREQRYDKRLIVSAELDAPGPEAAKAGGV